MGNIALGNISVDPTHIVASEMLQRLDLLQYEICEQIRTQKNDSAKSMAKLRYINTLIDMVNIGRHPDSVLGSKIAVLEKKEIERELMMKTSPLFAAKLLINSSDRLVIELKNTGLVPFEYGTITIIKKVAINGNTFFTERRPILHPGSTHEIDKGNINGNGYPKDSTFVITAMVWVESTYLREKWADKLSYGLNYTYLVNRKTKKCNFLGHSLNNE